MGLRRDFQLGIGVLVALQIITSFGAIGLLTRISPVIEEILDENIYTMEAAEQMLAVLAERQGGPIDAAMRERYRTALERARNNITERAEEGIIERLERESAATLDGDAASIRSSVDGIGKLVAVNRDVLLRADREAKRLGTAGAWAAVFIALGGFVFSVVVMSRMRRRILDPLEELYAVTQAVQLGEGLRRCRVTGAGAELKRVLESVNLLVDRCAEQGAPTEAATVDSDRAIALHLLDERPEPTFVVDEGGQIAAANSLGLSLLSGVEGVGLREKLRTVSTTAQPLGGIKVTPLPNAPLWLCAVQPV